MCNEIPASGSGRLYSKGELYNVKNDARAWEAFLRNKCGFEVARLENPDTEAFVRSEDGSFWHDSESCGSATFAAAIAGRRDIQCVDAGVAAVDAAVRGEGCRCDNTGTSYNCPANVPKTRSARCTIPTFGNTQTS
jgi:hypothetical protein